MILLNRWSINCENTVIVQDSPSSMLTSPLKIINDSWECWTHKHAFKYSSRVHTVHHFSLSNHTLWVHLSTPLSRVVVFPHTHSTFSFMSQPSFSLTHTHHLAPPRSQISLNGWICFLCSCLFLYWEWDLEDVPYRPAALHLFI